MLLLKYNQAIPCGDRPTGNKANFVKLIIQDTKIATSINCIM